MPSSHRWITRLSVSKSGDHLERASAGIMLNQSAYTRRFAFGYLLRSGVCTHRVPAIQTGHVGDTRRTRRTFPASLLNSAFNSSRIPRTTDGSACSHSSRCSLQPPDDGAIRVGRFRECPVALELDLRRGGHRGHERSPPVRGHRIRSRYQHAARSTDAPDGLALPIRKPLALPSPDHRRLKRWE